MQLDHLKHDRMFAHWLVVLVAAAVLFTGCREASIASQASAAPLPATLMWTGHQGGGPSLEPSVSWIDGPGAMDATQFPSRPALQAMARAVDWEHNGLVWIRMGQKPTGGFGMALKEAAANVPGDTVVLTVVWREPAKGAYVTQMITSPCMALQLARGDYRKIVVVDQSGRERARVDINVAP